MSISAIGSNARDFFNFKTNNVKDNSSKDDLEIKKSEEEYSEYLNVKEEASDLLKKISDFEGYWSWQIDKIKDKIKQDIMSEMGVTKESMASMDDSSLNDLGKKVMEEVERIFKEMVENDTLKSPSLRGDRLSEDVVSTLLLDI